LHTFEEYGLRFDIEISQPEYPHKHLRVDAECAWLRTMGQSWSYSLLSNYRDVLGDSGMRAMAGTSPRQR
jgi:hypothetical protein